MKNLSLGRLGERIASKYLLEKGFKILEMNFHKRWGELDIISVDPSSGSGQVDTLVFVEVKTRMEHDFVSPEESMTPWKINSVKKSALYYKMKHPELPESLRIDFLGIVLDQALKPIRINHIKNITM